MVAHFYVEIPAHFYVEINIYRSGRIVLRISVNADSNSAKSRTMISVIRGQFS